MSLQKIQHALHVPKGKRNDFGGFSYRNVADIVQKLKPLLVEYNGSLVMTDELVNIGDRYYIKATAVIHINGESVSAVGYAREAASKKGMDEAQVTGSTSSYARKYALAGLLAIDDSTGPSHVEIDSTDNTVESQRADTLIALKEAISEDDVDCVEDILSGIDPGEKKIIWAGLNKSQQDYISAMKEKA